MLVIALLDARDPLHQPHTTIISVHTGDACVAHHVTRSVDPGWLEAFWNDNCMFLETDASGPITLGEGKLIFSN